MLKKKDKRTAADEAASPVPEEALDLDTLDQASGGSLREVRLTQTTEITEDTKDKI